MDAPNLKSPQFYLNRELSFLEFNQRVLEQSKDTSLPLLERVRFLGISCSNLDEFFEIRVSSLKQRLELGSPQAGPDPLTLAEQLTAIHERATALVREQYNLLNDVLTPAMKQAGIRFAEPENWTPEQARWLEAHFEKEVAPVLSPLALDPARPFPRIQNKSLNFIVRVKGEDAFGRNTSLAIVQAPRSLPRIIRMPEDSGLRDFVYLSTVVEAFVARLFTGMEVLGCYQFRVTRNSDLFVDEEEVDDLLRAVEGELAQRRYGEAVRLETAHDCPADLVSIPAQPLRSRRPGPVPRRRPGQSQPPDGDLRTGRPARPEVPGVHRRHTAAPARRDRHLRHHPAERSAAAPPLPVIRARDGFRAPGCGRSGRAGHQADSVPHRRGLADRGCTGGRGAGGKGRDRHHRIACALRRGCQHRAGHATAGGGRARDVRRGGLQDARQADHGGAPGNRHCCAAIATSAPGTTT